MLLVEFYVQERLSGGALKETAVTFVVGPCPAALVWTYFKENIDMCSIKEELSYLYKQDAKIDTCFKRLVLLTSNWIKQND